MPESTDLVSTGEAAQMLGVSSRQVVRWANYGILPTAYRGHGVTGAFVFQRGDVAALAERRSADGAA
jgi:DNA-binding transcriptional MerR regulator